MNEVYLSNILEEVSVRNKDLGNIPVRSVTNQEGFCSPRDFFSKDVCSRDLSNYKVVKKGEFAYNPSRINVGSIDFLHEEFALVSPLYVTFKCKDSIVQDYLKYYLKGEKGNLYVRLKARGAVRDTLSFKSLAEIKIPLYPSKKQKQIVQTLDTADTIRQKRKEQLNLLDDYLKSIFFEMFGDPGRNDKSWKTGMIKDYITEKTCNGFFAKNDQYGVGTGIPVIWISDFINKFYANVTGLKRVNATAKDLEKYKVKYGDILFCRSSLNVEGIGKVGIVPKRLNEDIMFECHIIKVSIDITRIIPEFFRIFSDTPYFRRQIMKNSKTATMTTIGQDGVVNNKIYVPPIELQKKFASIIEQVEQTKQKMCASLDEMDNHFNALMQRYFG